MSKKSIIKQNIAWILSGFLTVLMVCLGLLVVSLGILILGHVLFHLSTSLLNNKSMEVFHYTIIMLVVTCTAGLAIPVIILARHIQRSAESFSLLQFDEETEEDEGYEDDEMDLDDDGEELNEFLRKLHKTRNIGPFIPSPKTMNDLCPCGSGLKYKDCCGKSWL